MCDSEATMDSNNGNWECKKCKSKGSLFDLETLILEGRQSTSPLYNPRKEKNRIKRELTTIKNKRPNDADLSRKLSDLGESIEKLFNYLSKGKKEEKDIS